MVEKKQGECFRCGKKGIVGVVCDKCAEEDTLEQAREDDYVRRANSSFDDDYDCEEENYEGVVEDDD